MALSVYRAHGARLVEAHGYTTEKNKKVPEDTVVMFLTKPGLCMLQAAWAEQQHRQGDALYGLPAHMDPLEGWIINA